MSRQQPKPSHVVPAGTKASQCRYPVCQATIYWIETKNGKKMPVDCDVPGGRAPSAFAVGQEQGDAFSELGGAFDGLGVSHFSTCPGADNFRTGRK